jgi:hypothetical protein
MRKQLIRVPQIAAAWDQSWLDLDKAASVEVSSEDQNYPIESALLGDEKRGWRAAEPGSQTIRLIFDSPQRLRHTFPNHMSVQTCFFRTTVSTTPATTVNPDIAARTIRQ